MTNQQNIVVAVSGTGRSLINLHEFARHHDSFTIKGVLTNNITCKAASWAHLQGLPVYHLTGFDTKAPADLCHWLQRLDCHWLVLAGFLKRCPTEYESYPQIQKRIVNIHPALLPAYGGQGMYGMRVHQQVFANRESQTGATVHFVNDKYDDGAIISQITIAIDRAADPQGIADAVFQAECKLLPHTLTKLITGELPLRQQIAIYPFDDQSQSQSQSQTQSQSHQSANIDTQ